MKVTILRLFLPAALLCALCTVESPGAGTVDFIKCRITASNPSAAAAFFDAGEYEFDAPVASVMSGVKGGLYIRVERQMEGGDRLAMTLHLLNGGRFEILRKNNAFECRVPRPPFTLTDRDCGGSDAPLRGLRPFPYIGIQRLIRRDVATFGGKSVWFDRFTIRFDEFRVEGGRLYLYATFEGDVAEKNRKMHEAGFGITGEINISGRPLGTMMTD
jgi:hypothetical protein